MKNLYRKILVVTLFSIAMGLLESAVVIYLREIMYPEGFVFPLAPIQTSLALTEILREFATVIMLLCVGMLAGKVFSQRFAWFMYSFAIWDIFYYVFLWILIDWPESLMTWDVLFLIPATWTGPVLSPLLLTFVMIIFSMIITIVGEKGYNTKIHKLEWGGLISGSLVVIVAFMSDYLKHMLSEFSFSELFNLSDPRLIEHASFYFPVHFPWLLFLAGVLVILSSVSLYTLRILKPGIQKTNDRIYSSV